MRFLCRFAALALLTSVFAWAAPPAVEPLPKIVVEPELLEQFRTEGATGYWIILREKADLTPAIEMEWEERGRFVLDTLRETAERTQPRLRRHLKSSGIEYQSFWIDNMILVKSSGLDTLEGLLTFPEIEALRARRHPVFHEPAEEGQGEPKALQPNLLHVGADQVWAHGYDGTGIVVANIDTGIRYTHDALVEKYRGCLDPPDCTTFDHNYSWWDPAAGGQTPAPTDWLGHGTHVMGIMLGDDGGDNQIGMAPGARWLTCKADVYTDAELIECGQFMVAPWDLAGANPDPGMRPHILNNSWGDCQLTTDTFYAGTVASWLAAGIYPIFTQGNSGNCGYPEPPGCGTMGNPGRYGNVTSVGATGQFDGQMTTFSLWGPTDDPDTVNPAGYSAMKPQVVAPGHHIWSAYHLSDDWYLYWGGTSMAAPHVAGTVALMWQAAPALIGNYAATETILEQTAVPIPYPTSCGGEGPGDHPNFAAGWGEIDAMAAVRGAKLATCPQITLTPQTPLPGGLLGAPYEATFSASGGTEPYTFSPSSGALPPGLTLDSDSGYLSGTIAQSGTFEFTITATDYWGCEGEQAYTSQIAAYNRTFVDDYGRSWCCLNDLTGDWEWTAMDPRAGLFQTPMQPGMAIWHSGILTFRSLAGMPWTMSLKYNLVYERANGYFQYLAYRIRSQLSDLHTADDPPVCDTLAVP